MYFISPLYNSTVLVLVWSTAGGGLPPKKTDGGGNLKEILQSVFSFGGIGLGYKMKISLVKSSEKCLLRNFGSGLVLFM